MCEIDGPIQNECKVIDRMLGWIWKNILAYYFYYFCHNRNSMSSILDYYSEFTNIVCLFVCYRYPLDQQMMAPSFPLQQVNCNAVLVPSPVFTSPIMIPQNSFITHQATPTFTSHPPAAPHGLPLQQPQQFFQVNKHNFDELIYSSLLNHIILNHVLWFINILVTFCLSFSLEDAASGSDSQRSHSGLIPHPQRSTAKHCGICTATTSTTAATAASSLPVQQPVGLQKHATAVAPPPREKTKGCQEGALSI